MLGLRSITRTGLKTAALGAKLGGHALQQVGDRLSHVASSREKNGNGHIDVEHRGGLTVVEPPKPVTPPKSASTATPSRAQTTPKPPVKTSAAPKSGPEKAAAAKPKAAAPKATTPPGPVPRRISNPKAAKAVRKREAAKASNVTKLEVPGETGHGGHPVSVRAENTPSERAAAKAGKEPAPMGSREDAS